LPFASGTVVAEPVSSGLVNVMVPALGCLAFGAAGSTASLHRLTVQSPSLRDVQVRVGGAGVSVKLAIRLRELDLKLVCITTWP
jgi:hypothetical protein